MGGKSRDKAPAAPADLPTDEQVRAYLGRNPDFLVRHPELAVGLDVPAPEHGDKVVDLQQFVIHRLRAELDEMRGCAEHLITTTRSNMSTQSRTHEAVLAVLSAGDMADLAQVMAEVLPPLLDVEVITLCFETGEQAIRELAVPGIHVLDAGKVDELLSQGGHSLLRGHTTGDPAVFGDGAGLVRSFAMVRLEAGGRCPVGLFALGSRDERTFHHSQGIDLLTFLARVIEHAARRWVEG